MPLSGEEVIREIRSRTDTVLLSFSCGKDAIGSWLALRPHFKIIPFYLYLVPDLQFVEQSLAYYEQFFGCRIIRVPHPSLYRMLNNFVFQPPERCAVIETLGLLNHSYDDVNELLREDYTLGPDTFMASGVRAADSPIRRAAINRFGPINWRRKTFWPVWDWNKARLYSELQSAGVKLPVDYRIFGRSFDGIDYRFLKPIKEHFPDDYLRILEYFPLADVELARRQYNAG